MNYAQAISSLSRSQGINDDEARVYRVSSIKKLCLHIKCVPGTKSVFFHLSS